jgi:hypothetical protein
MKINHASSIRPIENKLFSDENLSCEFHLTYKKKLFSDEKNNKQKEALEIARKEALEFYKKKQY